MFHVDSLVSDLFYTNVLLAPSHILVVRPVEVFCSFHGGCVSHDHRLNLLERVFTLLRSNWPGLQVSHLYPRVLPVSLNSKCGLVCFLVLSVRRE